MAPEQDAATCCFADSAILLFVASRLSSMLSLLGSKFHVFFFPPNLVDFCKNSRELDEFWFTCRASCPDQGRLGKKGQRSCAKITNFLYKCYFRLRFIIIYTFNLLVLLFSVFYYKDFVKVY